MMSTNGDSGADSPFNDDPPAAPRASLSPSLVGAVAPAKPGPAYEIKFVLDEEKARELEGRLLSTLLADPHADPTLGGMYAVTSLACDSPDFGVFFRDERMRNRKHRVRRYGASDVVYLERKRSRQGRVKKRRVLGALKDLGAVGAGRASDASQEWFVRELRELELAPICRIRYLRRALFGVCPEGPMRVTFDRRVRGSLASGWTMEFAAEERPLLDDVVVCEFKFHNAMPGPLKELVAAMKLDATGVSKYRTCIRAFAGELGIDLSRASPCAGAGGGSGVGSA